MKKRDRSCDRRAAIHIFFPPCPLASPLHCLEASIITSSGWEIRIRQYGDKIPTLVHVFIWTGIWQRRWERATCLTCFLCPVLSFHLSFQRGARIFFPLLFQTPNFFFIYFLHFFFSLPKLLASAAAAAAAAAASASAQCPIKPSYPCGKESFRSPLLALAPSIHHWYYFPHVLNYLSLFLNYPVSLEKRTCLNTTCIIN